MSLSNILKEQTYRDNQELKWSQLNDDVKMDILANTQEKNNYLKSINIWTLRDDIDALIDESAPTFKIKYENVDNLYRDLKRKNWEISKSNIKKLSTIDDYDTIDPVLMYNKDFLDGGHRLTLFKINNIKKIQTIDISNMIDMDWEKWYEGEVDF